LNLNENMTNILTDAVDWTITARHNAELFIQYSLL